MEEVGFDKKWFLVGGVKWEKTGRKATFGGNTSFRMWELEEGGTGTFLILGMLGLVGGTKVLAGNGWDMPRLSARVLQLLLAKLCDL